MKGSILGKWMYVTCALAGCLIGCWLFTLAETEIKSNTITEDNTLSGKSGDSVFFDEKKEVTIAPVPTGKAVNETAMDIVQQEEIQPTVTVVPTQPPAPVEAAELAESSVAMQTEEKETKKEAVTGQAVITVVPDSMPSLASQWALNRPETMPEPEKIAEVRVAEREEIKEKDSMQEVAEVITYPVEIFGQVPVLNRSDAYVSYFEFTYDLVTMMESEVKQRGMNMTALMTKFAVKALFCGVDIEQLDINAPIPREQAALTLWLAAGLLGEKGSDTSAKTAQTYVTDLGGCSSSEKKAVAYLYEQGIVPGYNKAGQQFYPDAGLKTEAGNAWLYNVKQRWQ